MARTTSADTMTAQDYRENISEAEWRKTVRREARDHGWEVLVELPDKTYRLLAEIARKNPRQGKLTPPGGMPDFIFGRRGPLDTRVIVVELKVGKGRLSPAQVRTLNLFKDAGVETYVWYPKDRDRMVEVLK